MSVSGEEAAQIAAAVPVLVRGVEESVAGLGCVERTVVRVQTDLENRVRISDQLATNDDVARAASQADQRRGRLRPQNRNLPDKRLRAGRISVPDAASVVESQVIDREARATDLQVQVAVVERQRTAAEDSSARHAVRPELPPVLHDVVRVAMRRIPVAPVRAVDERAGPRVEIRRRLVDVVRQVRDGLAERRARARHAARESSAQCVERADTVGFDSLHC